MPSKSKAQQHFMGMCYGAAKEGKRLSGCPNMTRKQLRDFAATKTKGLPARKRKK